MQTCFIELTRPELSPKNLVLSLGGFDGIHLGHQALIKQLVSVAKKKKTSSALCIFDPLPYQVLKGITPYKRLFTILELEDILRDFGLDYFCIIPFDKKFSKLKPFDFVKTFLNRHFKPLHLVVGYDFAFAHQKTGNFSTLESYGKNFGFSVEKSAVYLHKKEPVSSSRVRKSLALADMPRVKHLLGRPFSIQSQVIKGEGRGQKLGFPTANLKLEHKQYPAPGVYAGYAYVEGMRQKMLVNIGYRPTFHKKTEGNNKAELVIEAHIPFKRLNLYDKLLKLDLELFIRKEQVFSSPLALKQQIQTDIQTITEI